MKTLLGIGNAVTDIYVSLPDNSLLERYSIAPGSISHVAREEAQTLLTEAFEAGYNMETIPGGSAANTVALGAQMGLQCGFIGKVGSDLLGDGFIRSLQHGGVDCRISRGLKGSGVAIVFVTPAVERTFVVSPGAALELEPDELDPEVFAKYGHLHLEGFIMECHGVAQRALQLAKEMGLTVSFDIGSRRIAKKHNLQLKRLIGEYADIVFATVDEATAYTGPIHKDIAPVTVVKYGPEGSIVYSGGNAIKIEAYPTEVVDTTGAGDAYAAGFLKSCFNGLSLYECGHSGSRIASEVVGKRGARLLL